MTKRYNYAFLLVVVFALFAAACTSSDDTTTTTAAAAGAAETTTTAAAPAETTTTAAPAAEAGELTFWTTEKEPARVAKQQDIVDAFTAATGIPVQMAVVNEDLLPQVMLTNAASGTLPDVVFHPLELAVLWANAGITDSAAAQQVISDLGESGFSQGALSLATGDNGVASVPSDGWGQLLIYRKDLFDAAGLEKPDTFDKIQAAAEALNDPANDFYGITASTDVARFTQQTWEHFALANNCQLVDEAGNITLDTPECVEAIQFYADLINNYSPKGLQDVVTTRATYFAGQAAMIIWSPFILDEMAGLRDAALPTCPECVDDIAYLAKNSDFVPAFAGPSGAPAQYGQVSYMGIGTTDNTEASIQFVEYWLSDGYLDWLGVAPEGKFPMRQGTTDDPTLYIEGWRELTSGVDRKAPLSDYYSEDVINGLITGSNNFARWGFIEGQGELVGAVYATDLVPQVLEQVLAGDLTAEEGAALMQELSEEEQSFLGG
jgi:multiple sugar transport system substrate-binding protein